MRYRIVKVEKLSEIREEITHLEVVKGSKLLDVCMYAREKYQGTLRIVPKKKKFQIQLDPGQKFNKVDKDILNFIEKTGKT